MCPRPTRRKCSGSLRVFFDAPKKRLHRCGSARPAAGTKPSHECSGPLSALERSGPSNATLQRLEKFAQATAAEPLLSTHAASLARVALGFVKAFRQRCAGLKSGTVPALRSYKAEEASLTQQVTTAKSAFAGLENFMNTTVARSKEPVAKALLAAWASSE